MVGVQMALSGGIAGGDLHRDEDSLGTPSYPPGGTAVKAEHPQGKYIRADIPVLIYTGHTWGE